MEHILPRSRAWLIAVAALPWALVTPGFSQTEDEPKPTPPPPRSIRVGDAEGRVQIAQEYGPPSAGMALMPSGQIVFFNHPVYTEEAFRPATMDEMRDQLLASEFRGFQSRQTEHYLILYQCTPRFAEHSAKLLESLYQRLLERMTKMKFEVHAAEFPLVAVIYGDEDDFRKRRKVDPDVQAYYEVMSNRIYFYEESTRQREDPMFEAMRKPQTVAHEGTHQVMNNIGIHPRFAEWPPWLVEGLAELAASGSENSRAGEWVGFSKVNQLHIATLDDLEDDLTQQAGGNTRGRVGAHWGRSLVEYIITREQLNPTDYALAWTVTHFLANERRDDFIAYLKEMGQRVPGAKRDAAADLALFRKHFGDQLLASDQPVRKHVANLRKKSSLTYYAVMYQQSLGGNLARRATLVSRSPQVIREWVEQRMYDPRGGPFEWRAVPFRTKQQAFLYTEQWLATPP